MSRPVVIVMVKAPRAGLAKTRLVPPLSASEAASLAACLAQDVVTNARAVVPDLIIAYAPADGRATLETLLPHGLLWLAQQGEGLGERLDAVVAHATKLGFSPLLIIGADSPTLPRSFIETACDALVRADADVALGPTADGGYYLVGIRTPAPHLFQNISWSTPLAYRQTADNATRLGLRLLRLPSWYDVDTFSDLLQLRDEIFSDAQARALAPYTYRWLRAHDLTRPPRMGA